MAGMSTVTAAVLVEFKWTCQNNLAGANYNATTNAGDIRKTYNFGTAVANNASGGGDEVFSVQQTVSGGTSASMDLTTMVNLLQQAGVNIVRIKAVVFKLLSSVDDTSVSINASAVQLTNRNVAVPAALFPNGGTGLTLALTAVAGVITAVAIGAAGSGYPPSDTFTVVPQQAGGSGGLIYVTTNASGVPTAVGIISGAGGTGYTSATVPSTPSGAVLLNGGPGSPPVQGGCYCYFDATAAGFMAVSATAKNILFVNLDVAPHTATIECDFLAATT